MVTKIKNLDVQDIQQQVDSTKDFISKTKENVEQVKQALNGVTTLHDGFAGNTADSIRSFYEEAHKPFLEFMESFLVQYEQALSTVSDQVLSFEPNESGFIRQEFLEGELTNKMQKAQDSLSATTDMINQQLNSVSDLASVSHVKDSVFLESIADAKKKISKTVDNMYEMDSNATSKLDKSEDDMQQMKTYMSKLRNAIDKNNISVENFNITQFNSEFFSYHNEFKLMAKGRNALATGDSAEITAEEFNKLYPYIKNEKNVIDEYYEWDGTYHTLKDGRIIRHYMHDTGESYEFVDKIPEPRSKPLSDTEEFVYGAVGGVWNFFTEDLATVLNPEATKGEKAFALAMFLPVGKPVKIIDKGSGFVSDAIKSLEKIITSNSAVKKKSKDTNVDLSSVQRIEEVEVNFKRNPKHDPIEFERQLQAQERGLNSLTVDGFLGNRNKYLTEGRATQGNTAQRLARQEALNEKILELRKQGLSRNEAKLEANNWLKSQAALHNPDQIAGGNPTDIGGLGDKKINSSLGSQWKSRIKEVDDHVRQNSNLMSKEAQESTYLNIKLKEKGD